MTENALSLRSETSLFHEFQGATDALMYASYLLQSY